MSMTPRMWSPCWSNWSKPRAHLWPMAPMIGVEFSTPFSPETRAPVSSFLHARGPCLDQLRLCCMEAAQRALAPARDQLRDTDADGLPEIAHTIERFHGNCDFGHAAGVVAGFQDISDHALVTTDCRFDLRAHVIAGGLLPIHAPMLFDRKDMPVAL